MPVKFTHSSWIHFVLVSQFYLSLRLIVQKKSVLHAFTYTFTSTMGFTPVPNALQIIIIMEIIWSCNPVLHKKVRFRIRVQHTNWGWIRIIVFITSTKYNACQRCEVSKPLLPLLDLPDKYILGIEKIYFSILLASSPN